MIDSLGRAVAQEFAEAIPGLGPAAILHNPRLVQHNQERTPTDVPRPEDPGARVGDNGFRVQLMLGGEGGHVVVLALDDKEIGGIRVLAPKLSQGPEHVVAHLAGGGEEEDVPDGRARLLQGDGLAPQVLDVHARGPGPDDGASPDPGAPAPRTLVPRYRRIATIITA